jgi:hypothetical protein
MQDDRTYYNYYHTAADTLDKVDPHELGGWPTLQNAVGVPHAFEESVGFSLFVLASPASIVVRSFPLLDVRPSDDKL